VLTEARNEGGGALKATVAATGGDGSSGGDVHVGVEALDATGSGVTVVATANAGAGLGVGGTGGDVTFGPIFASSAAGGRVDVTANFRAGSGVDGRDLELTDAVDGETTGSLRLAQTARGGTAAGGAAGRASSTLTRDGAYEQLTLESRADGAGPSGGTFGMSSATAGAEGRALAAGSNSAGRIDVIAAATGGLGGNAGANVPGGRRGGDAYANASGTSSGDGHEVRVDGSAVAGRGGDAFQSFAAGGPSYPGGRGGDATSVSRGEAFGDSVVEVQDHAESGRGGRVGPVTPPGPSGGDGGDASSRAIAIGAGPSRVSALAVATSGGAGSFEEGPNGPEAVGGTATASADARGAGEVEARAQGIGFFPAQRRLDASAVSHGAGTISTVDAHAVSSDGSGRVDALAGIGSATAPPPFQSNALSGDAFGMAAPDPGALDLRLGSGSRVEAQLAGESDALALGVLGVSFASPDFEGSVRFALSTPESGGLLLGLANPIAAGAGFATLVFAIEIGGQLFLEQTFTDVESALAFFDDEILALGVVDLRDVKIAMRTSTASATDRFQFDFVLMTVPEPGTGALLLVALVGLAGARRARRVG
jgi:hypothetical protein